MSDGSSDRRRWVRSGLNLVLWIALCGVPIQCVAGPSALTIHVHVFRFKYTDLIVRVNDGVKIVPRKNLPDFDVYDFQQGTRHLLSAYVGDHPDFHMLSYHKAVSIKHRLADGLKITDIVYQTTSKGATREVLIQEKWSDNDVHFWYDDAPADLSQEADNIIGSIKMTR